VPSSRSRSRPSRPRQHQKISTSPHAADTNLAAREDQDLFEGSWRGETWLEALEEHAMEMGPAPEEEVVIIDDSDIEHPDHRGHHPTEWRDRPIADKGSGGPGGLSGARGYPA
jgi:hypothetical protein